jgi:hypothetical protein
MSIGFDDPNSSPPEVVRAKALELAREISCDRFGLLAFHTHQTNAPNSYCLLEQTAPPNRAESFFFPPKSRRILL